MLNAVIYQYKQKIDDNNKIEIAKQKLLFTKSKLLLYINTNKTTNKRQKMKKIETTIKFQLIQFVKNQNRILGRPLTRREIAKEYERITGKTNHHNLSNGLCFGLNDGHGGFNNWCTEGYLCRNTGYGRIKAIARNQYIAE